MITLLLLVRTTYMYGVVSNATGEVATVVTLFVKSLSVFKHFMSRFKTTDIGCK